MERKKCSYPALCRVLCYILACETILSSAYQVREFSQKAYMLMRSEKSWPLSTWNSTSVNLCCLSLLSRQWMCWSFHWDPQREVTKGHHCCHCGWLLFKLTQNWFHTFRAAAPRLQDKLTAAPDHAWRDDTGIRSTVTPKTASSAALHLRIRAKKVHPCTYDHVRSSHSSSAKDVFAKGWREPSLLLPPISCLARGIHSNWKSKSKAWGLRRIWERHRGGPCIPHTRAHFNASVRQSGYQSAAVAAQIVFFPLFFCVNELKKGKCS